MPNKPLQPTPTRREVLYTLGAAFFSAARPSAQAGSLEFDGIDHVEFYVSQVERTRDFFASVFGNTVLRNATAAKNYLKIGSAYLAFERPRTAGGPLTADHVSVAIRNIDMAQVHAVLDAGGIPYRDYPSGRDTAVVDADGVRTQLSPENGWSFLRPPTFAPEAVVVRAEAVFRPEGIEQVLLNVSEPDASAKFYEKIFGSVALRNNNRIWFRVGRSRVGLVKTPEGQRPGVHHFCVSAAAFDYDAVIARLTALGAKIEPPELPGAPSFRDPDGMLVQVSAAV
jgi:catechol 2,3-dioxygenase-like lactoylglutathione lyase family enzyme